MFSFRLTENIKKVAQQFIFFRPDVVCVNVSYINDTGTGISKNPIGGGSDSAKIILFRPRRSGSNIDCFPIRICVFNPRLTNNNNISTRQGLSN